MSEDRQRAVNFINLVTNAIESYPLGHVHGIQKDAIQNGWDARFKKDKGFVSENWRFEFELIENKGQALLVMTDFGTHGLTGNKLADDIDEEKELSQDERWARWESLGWNKVGKEDLGARGQGKMILMGASKEHKMVYDSLRRDSTYRVGWTQAGKTACPVNHLDGEAGKKYLKDNYNLDPIDHFGTRIIIVNPQEELLSSIRSGLFIDYIEETWWPIILNYGARIIVKCGKSEKTAEVPSFLLIKEKDGQTEDFKFWYKENIKVDFKKKSYKLKKLVIAYKSPTVPDQYEGVAVFRSGMKVDRVDFINKDLKPYVYGFVEFDENLEEELRSIELPSHYGFRAGGVWHKVKSIIEDEMELFGNKKLGLGIDYKEIKKEKRTNAQNKAMHVLRVITKNWPLLSSSKGTGGGGGKGGLSPKQIGVELHNLVFPDANIPKLNWGDNLNGFSGNIFNKLGRSIKVKYNADILSGDRIIKSLDELDITLSDKEVYSTKKYAFLVEKALFKSPGEYKIILKLIDAESSTKLDTIVRRFWVETEPQLKGLFEMKATHFSALKHVPDISEEMEWYLISEGDNNYTFLYNLDHPSYQDNEDPAEKQAKYISEISMQAALQLLIKRGENGEIDSHEKMDLPFDIDKVLCKEGSVAYLETVRAISVLKYKINSVL